MVLLDGTSNERQTLHYHAIVVATGSSAREGMPWKNLESTEHTKTALASYRQQMAVAKTVVVAGAGATGSEVAGELGTAFGKSGEKNIILVSRGDLPLDQDTMHSVRKTVQKELEQLQVRVIYNAEIKNVTISEPNEPKIIAILRTSGEEETIKADIYLPTFGVRPNSTFMPRELLDDSGFIQQTWSLRSPSYDNVFVVGDVGNLQVQNAVNADSQALRAAQNLETFLAGGEIKEFKPDPKVQFAVAMGDRGAGQVGSWKLWSILVWWVKGRYLGTQYAGEIAAGTRTMLSKTLQ